MPLSLQSGLEEGDDEALPPVFTAGRWLLEWRLDALQSGRTGIILIILTLLTLRVVMVDDGAVNAQAAATALRRDAKAVVVLQARRDVAIIVVVVHHQLMDVIAHHERALDNAQCHLWETDAAVTDVASDDTLVADTDATSISALHT
ncbi:hypothetical protein GUJ93_ZPchr0010g11135 [Zizania palustris]|uniref:Uncharacterized protein n=1 Tax=Zizania palustris TaxID=103762 RepID=A0A8J5WCJ1_ZIZPA|nr:hypothetical protein GUJ93_ZPchr0010g11135 [Zizania palustris]